MKKPPTDPALQGRANYHDARRQRAASTRATPLRRALPDPAVATPPPAVPPPVTQQAVVTGSVEYREGDGANMRIRCGPVEVVTTQADATLSWVDGDTRGSTAMPLGDFKRFVAQGLISLQPSPA